MGRRRKEKQPSENEMNRELMSTQQAAAFLGMSRTTFWRLTTEGKIPQHRIEGSPRIIYRREDLLNIVKPVDRTLVDRSAVPTEATTGE